MASKVPKRPHDLGEEVAAWLRLGCWSACGMAANVQPRPLTVYADKTFYLQAPQVWVIQELFTDEDLMEDVHNGIA